MQVARLIVHVLLGVYAVLLAYIILGLVLGFTISADIFFDLSFALLFFALAQSIFELGTRNAVIFLIFSSFAGFAAEVLGTNTGFPFGDYGYSELLGSKLLGVPVVVPLIWFVISYITLSILLGAFHIIHRPAGATLSISALAAFGAMAWDLLIDPMFTSYGYWTWSASQPIVSPRLSGVPLTNFLGWFVLVFVVISLYLGFMKGSTMIPRRKNTYDSYAAYVMLLIDGVIANWQLGHYLVIGIGSLAMVVFLVSSFVYSSMKSRTQEILSDQNKVRVN